MAAGHVHATIAIDAGLWVFVIPYLFAVGSYVAGMVIEQRRGNEWSWGRAACWMLGCTFALFAVLGPLTSPSFAGFAGHMVTHVLIGMVAPLLLVLGAPVTLALRTMDVLPARRLTRILRSRPVAFLTAPLVAATLNVGGMWALYLTPLHALADVPLFHLLLMAHFLLIGVLFTASIVSVDPNPHRASIRTRLIVLVLAIAAHGVLAKLLFAQPVPGVDQTQAELGAQIMYYGGDVVDLALMVLLLAEWYRVSGRRLLSRSTAARSIRTPVPAIASRGDAVIDRGAT